MDNIKNITDIIVQQANDEAAKLLKAAGTQLESDLSENEIKLEQAFHEKTEQLKQWSEERIRAAHLRKQSALQKERTRYKKQLLEQVFSEAELTLSRMPAGQFLDFYRKTLDCLTLRGLYTLRIGQQTAETLREEDWDALCITNENYSVTVSRQTIPNAGGFRLEQFPVEYSFLYHELLEEIKAQEGSKVMKQLLD